MPRLQREEVIYKENLFEEDEYYGYKEERIISEITVKRMASIKECEKLRGAAVVTLQAEIRKLRKACEVEAPNKRLVANLVASLDIAQDNLIDYHVDLVMEMNAQQNEPRFTQYISSFNTKI